MIDDNEMEAAMPIGAAVKARDASAPSKTKTARRQRKTPVAVLAPSKAAGGRPRRYSEPERSEKLALIEGVAAAGSSTLKQAILGAGISEQTYYQWKRTAQSNDKSAEKPVIQSTPVADALEDLARLETENQRLRKLLADKLREENAELRKRLGFD